MPLNKIIMIAVEADEDRAREIAEDMTYYLSLDGRSSRASLVGVEDVIPALDKLAGVATPNRPNGQRVRVVREIDTGTRMGDWHFIPGDPSEARRDLTAALVAPSVPEEELPYAVRRILGQVWVLSQEEQRQVAAALKR